MYHYYYSNMRSPGVVAHARGDVNGDKIPDFVYLTGNKISEGGLVEQITLGIQNGATGAQGTIPLKDNVGYNPTLFLGDFTGNGVDDIFVQIQSGGSGATTYDYIYSYVQDHPRLLFDSDVFNQQYQYSVTYKDNYKVEVVSKKNQTKYLIDLTLKGPEYLNEIYDRNGKLKQPISGWVDPISGLYPIDYNSDGVYDLLAYQQIAGRYHADSLGYVVTQLKWNGHQFALANQQVAIFGSLQR